MRLQVPFCQNGYYLFHVECFYTVDGMGLKKLMEVKRNA